MTGKYVAPQDVADELGVDVQTVRRWIHGGKLRAYKPGKEIRIREADLEEFLRAREVRPKVARRSPFEPSFNDVLEEERHTSPEQWREAARRAGGGEEVDSWAKRGSHPRDMSTSYMPTSFKEYMFETLQEVERGEKSAEEAMRELVPGFAAD